MMKVETILVLLLAVVIVSPFGCTQVHTVPPEAPAQPSPPPAVHPPQPVAPKAAPLAPVSVEPPFTHQVKWPGETFIAIAQWYTGRENNWTRLAQANPAINPQRIHIGDMIIIPKDLLETRQPMPRKVLSPGKEPKQKPLPPPSVKPSVKTDDIELFGPVESEPRKEVTAPELPVSLETLD